MMTRYPVAGAAKTRLAPVLGAEGAAELHRQLASYCLARIIPVAATREADLVISTDGGTRASWRRWMGRLPAFRRQPEGDLGRRLHAAFADGFNRGHGSVVAVGADCPDCSAQVIRAALAALEDADVVLGPAEDGGYYLVGTRHESADAALPALMGGGIAWGGPRVLADSLERVRSAGLSVALLSEFRDIDRPEDLPAWALSVAEQERVTKAPQISVVIPSLNEESDIADAVLSALAGGAEVIVADGGSSDRTRERAEACGARVVRCPEPGRAVQMNAGAATASGDTLVFLHGDAVLPDGYADAVCTSLARPGVVAAAFGFEITNPLCWWECVAAAGGRLRARLGLPYGDQGLCLRRTTFEDLGGFPLLPALEDYEMSSRLSRMGRIDRIDLLVSSSARAWREHGLLRVTLHNATAIALHRAGGCPEQVARARARIGREPAVGPLRE